MEHKWVVNVLFVNMKKKKGKEIKEVKEVGIVKSWKVWKEMLGTFERKRARQHWGGEYMHAMH